MWQFIFCNLPWGWAIRSNNKALNQLYYFLACHAYWEEEGWLPSRNPLVCVWVYLTWEVAE